MKESNLNDMRRSAESGRPISEETALAILACGADEIPDVLQCATRVRKRRFGDVLTHCSIMNAKSGACSEDCAFCAQSIHHQTHIQVSGLSAPEDIVATYDEASRLPVRRFGVVTSGRALKDADIDRLCEAPRMRPRGKVSWCASFGCLDEDRLRNLKEAGFTRFHHNLETSRSFFPSICSTHSYDLRIETLRAAKKVGLETCCGGILGLGESPEQRVEFASTLAAEQVDSMPLNFLIPLEGTRMELQSPLRPLDMIRIIAMFRMMNPEAELRVCAGRVHLRDLQSMVFYAGATGIMIGALLTTAGRNVDNDLQMLEDLEFQNGDGGSI